MELEVELVTSQASVSRKGFLILMWNTLKEFTCKPSLLLTVTKKCGK
jgi:hypothetical protein